MTGQKEEDKEKEKKEEKKFLRTDGRTDQSKVVQKVLADLKKTFAKYKAHHSRLQPYNYIVGAHCTLL